MSKRIILAISFIILISPFIYAETDKNQSNIEEQEESIGVWETYFIKYNSKSELIGIAGIHATLLAIIIASLSAYTFFISEKILNLQHRAITEAYKINEIEYYRYFGGLDKNEVWNKKELVKNLYEILSKHDDPSVDEFNRGFKALGIMNAIMCQYPFCHRHFKTDDGRFGSREDPEPIIFEDYKSVQAWVNEIAGITNPLISIWNLRKDFIISLFEEYSKTDIAKSNIENCFKLAETNKFFFEKHLIPEIFCNPASSCKDFFSKLIGARNITKNVKYHIKQADAYKSKIIPLKTLALFFIMIFLVFIFGVIFPLFLSSVSTIWFLWIPFILYGVGYLYLAFRILRFTLW